MTPFDFLNAINTTKQDVMNEDNEKEYVPFVVNRTLSYFQDTVLLANEINANHHADNRLQFDFYKNVIRKRKRFTKWGKPQTSDAIEVVKQYFDYSYQKAVQVLPLLNTEEIESMRLKMSRGGRKK